MLASEKLERLTKVLVNLSQEEKPIIVEGKRDRSALRRLGVDNVITLGRGEMRVADQLRADAIVLTDFDSEGRRLAARLRDLLNSSGFNADLDYRREIRRHSGITCIEELPSRIEQMEKMSKKGER